MVGTKNTQGRPLMDALTERGWVCVAINYRLSPRSKFPDHLIDCKLALAWIRENIGVHGGDPNRVVVTGGSAGGHLATMVALTANEPRYQPEFETVDTSVVGCVSMYGVYDLEAVFSYGSPISRPIAGRMGAAVMGVTPAEDIEAYRAASPIDIVRPGIPPFLLVHGSIDNLVPVEQARAVSARLAEVGAEVTYVELPGAPHARRLPLRVGRHVCCRCRALAQLVDEPRRRTNRGRRYRSDRSEDHCAYGAIVRLASASSTES